MVAAPTPDEIRPASTGSAAPKGRERLQALTGLRFVAAVLVVMFHFLLVPIPPGPGLRHAVAQAIAHVIASGYTGVGFFFLLSGFILAYNYIDAQGRMRVAGSRFWQARFARIYPVYALAMLVAAVPYVGWGQWHEQYCVGHHALLSGNQPVVTIISSIFVLPGWLPCAMTWNAPAWSLSAEVFFYLLFPLIALGMARLPRRALLATAVVCWALLLAAALAFIALSLDASAMHAAWWERYWTWVFYTNPVLRLPEFLIGVALGRFFLQRDNARPRAGLARLVSTRYLSVVAALAIIVVWCIGPLPLILFNQVVLDPLYALLIYCLACGEGPIAALFALPGVVLLGEASYGLYILHWPIRFIMGHYLPHLPVPLPAAIAPNIAYFVVYLCVAVGVSILSFLYMERPARRAINHAFGAVGRRRIGRAQAS